MSTEKKIGFSLLALGGAVLLYFVLPMVVVILAWFAFQIDFALAQVITLFGGLASFVVPFLAFGWWMYRIWLQEPEPPEEPSETVSEKNDE